MDGRVSRGDGFHQRLARTILREVGVGMIPFANRHGAGLVLARYFEEYSGRSDVVVIALPRGGVPVALAMAQKLNAPMDVLTVRNLGAPWNPKLTFGAVTTGGIYFIDEDMVRNLGIGRSEIEQIIARERMELEQQEQKYRVVKPLPAMKGKIIILVDDGLATGAMMRMAVRALRQKEPHKIIAAAPVASNEACTVLSMAADGCICVINPSPFYGVGMWYENFSEVTDEEILSLVALRDRKEKSAAFPNLAFNP